MIFGVNANGTPVKFKRTRYNPIMGDRREYSRIARLARLKKLNWVRSNQHKVIDYPASGGLYKTL